MAELKTVKEIDVDYSKSQIYWRVEKLIESGAMDPLERGDRNQYLFSQEDVRKLQKLAKLEDEHDTVQEAVTALKEEGLEKKESKEEDTSTKSIDEETVEKLRERIDELEETVELLEEKLALQEDRIQKFRNRWSDQLKDGVERIKDLFG